MIHIFKYYLLKQGLMDTDYSLFAVQIEGAWNNIV